MDANVYAKELDVDTAGSESVQIFSQLPSYPSYGVETESPGIGPTINSAEIDNLIPNNYDFTSWNGNSPLSWSMSGTITTDYSDKSGTGVGPLFLKTQGTTATQQVTGLSHLTTYIMGVVWYQSADTNQIQFRIKTLAGTTLGSSSISHVIDALNSDVYAVGYTHFVLDETVDLDDVYAEIEYEVEYTTAHTVTIEKVFIVPATWYNGLGWAYIRPFSGRHTTAVMTQSGNATMVVANTDGGVFQTFFRKAYNVQLPTADSPSINDSLAT